MSSRVTQPPSAQEEAERGTFNASVVAAILVSACVGRVASHVGAPGFDPNSRQLCDNSMIRSRHAASLRSSKVFQLDASEIQLSSRVVGSRYALATGSIVTCRQCRASAVGFVEK